MFQPLDKKSAGWGATGGTTGLSGLKSAKQMGVSAKWHKMWGPLVAGYTTTTSSKKEKIHQRAVCFVEEGKAKDIVLAADLGGEAVPDYPMERGARLLRPRCASGGPWCKSGEYKGFRFRCTSSTTSH
jgi:hypothetical protein